MGRLWVGRLIPKQKRRIPALLWNRKTNTWFWSEARTQQQHARGGLRGKQRSRAGGRHQTRMQHPCAAAAAWEGAAVDAASIQGFCAADVASEWEGSERGDRAERDGWAIEGDWGVFCGGRGARCEDWDCGWAEAGVGESVGWYMKDFQSPKTDLSIIVGVISSWTAQSDWLRKVDEWLWWRKTVRLSNYPRHKVNALWRALVGLYKSITPYTRVSVTSFPVHIAAWILLFTSSNGQIRSPRFNEKLTAIWTTNFPSSLRLSSPK